MWNHKVPLLPEYKVHSRLFSTCWNKNYQSTQARRVLNFPKIALTTENYRYLIFYNWHNWCTSTRSPSPTLSLPLYSVSVPSVTSSFGGSSLSHNSEPTPVGWDQLTNNEPSFFCITYYVLQENREGLENVTFKLVKFQIFLKTLWTCSSLGGLLTVVW